jgi:type II secretory pathway pseudopilin PulG
MSRSAYSLVELVLCLGLVVLLGAVAAPGLMAGRDSVRADGAADYVSALLHGARMEALRRRASVAIRFETDEQGCALATYVDGDGNGVRSTDISSGVDTLLRPRERIEDKFTDVSFGFEPGVPDVDGAETMADADPIRVGRSRMLSFSPTGTSSTGTVYLRGRGRRQVAVRVLGVTGRIRTLWFDFGAGLWQSR